MHAFIQVVGQIPDPVPKSRDLSFSQGFGSADSMKCLKTNLLLFCIGHFYQKYLCSVPVNNSFDVKSRTDSILQICTCHFYMGLCSHPKIELLGYLIKGHLEIDFACNNCMYAFVTFSTVFHFHVLQCSAYFFLAENDS